MRTYAIKTADEQPLTAILDDSGLLRVSGSGVNEEWTTPDDVPWKEERSLIRSVRFDGNVQVENLMNWIFGCDNLIEIENWPEKAVKLQAVCCDCHKLKVLPHIFPNSLEDMDEAFIRCYSLESVPELPPRVKYAADAFADCFVLAGTITICSPIEQFAYMFQNTGKNGTGIMVDYMASCAGIIDQVLATKADGKVKKGTLIKTSR